MKRHVRAKYASIARIRIYLCISTYYTKPHINTSPPASPSHPSFHPEKALPDGEKGSSVQ